MTIRDRRPLVSALLVAVGLASVAAPLAAQEPAWQRGFIFGSRFLDCASPNEPSERYEVVLHGSVAELAYDAGRGWGYERVDPTSTDRGGYAVFGPFDESPNGRTRFPDTCPHEIYDSFIGAKNFAAPCSDGSAPPCLPLEGIVFRVDVPNGTYRFVAAVGSADNLHAHRLIAEDGGSGPPANLGSDHVVLVDNFDQGAHGAGVFARVGFESYLPPMASVDGFVDMDSNGEETTGPAESPALEVTRGYIRIHQLKGVTAGGDPNGGDLVVLELWRVDGGGTGGEGPYRAVDRGATWRYIEGIAEPLSDWTEPDYDDSLWKEGPAPIGYGEAGIATDLALGSPPMEGNYTSLYLRATFDLADPTAVSELTARIRYDDGFILYGNGIELLRTNAGGTDGVPLPFGSTAAGGHEAASYEEIPLPNPIDWLRSGHNVVAVHALNSTIGSSDLFFDAEIFDPFAPDLRPPAIASVAPFSGATVRRLEEIRIDFDEEVTGVDASDLLVGGVPASAVSGDGDGPWVFTFPSPPPGPVAIRWAEAHGITDLSEPPNPFAGGSWSYVLDPDAPAADIAISEILAVKNGGPLDEDGEESDFIELVNLGSAVVDLTGWSFTERRGEPGEWTFSGGSIAPGEYLVVFASGKDRQGANGNIHTSFKLASEGQYVGLYDGDAPPRLVAEIAPRYPPQRAGVSFGRDGSGRLVWFAQPTPGARNSSTTTFDGFILEPRATPGRGFYEDPVLVTLSSASPGASIRYTLDGSEPTSTRGTVYASPFEVRGTARRGVVTIRAVAYKSGSLPSKVATFSYVFPEHVMTQPSDPDGFPSSWNGQPADYAMDPRIVNDPGHRNLVREGLVSIPTLSVVTNVDDLFHATRGIYANPSRDGEAWERTVSAELIYPDGRNLQLDCGLRVQGGSSVDNWKVIKVSLRLLFKGDHGPTKLRWRLFPDSRVDEFDTIVLDAHMNQTWQHPSVGQRVRAQYCRDQYTSDLQNATGGYGPHDVFANLYLNGLYWGVFDLHERPDSTFGASYFGGDESEYDALRHSGSEVVDGSTTAWNQMMSAARRDLSSNANYLALGEWLDIPNLADYMIVNLWAGNDDWAHHNWYATRRRGPGGLYRFHSWDAEHVLKDININRVSINNANSPTELYTRLRTNREFRLLFADRVHRHFSHGGPFWVDRARPSWDPDHPEDNRPAALWMRRIDEIDPAIACEAARWGDTRQPNDPHTRNDEWLAELDWLLTRYFPVRSEIVLAQLSAAGLYPDTEAPSFSLPSGRIDPGRTVTISAPGGGAIWYTIDGSDPRRFGTEDVAPGAMRYTSPVRLDDHTVLRARILAAGEWSAIAEAVYTLADPRDLIEISEIHFHPEDDGDAEFIELRNTGALTVGLDGAAFIAGIGYVFPPGSTLGPGEALVLVADPAAFGAAHPEVDPFGTYEGRLANGGEDLELVDREGRTITAFRFRDDGAWPVGADGLGWSLTLAAPGRNPADPESWTASSVRGGTPGRATDPGPFPPPVVLSEVLARSLPPYEDAIELYNPTPSAVDVSGWYLSVDRSSAAAIAKVRIPNGTIVPAFGYAAVYQATFSSGPLGFTLDDRGGAVWLASATQGGALTGHVSEIAWKAQATNVSFGRVATAASVTFPALTQTTFGADFPQSIVEFRGGTGLPNAGPLFGPVVLNEIHYHPLPDREEFIELYNPSGVAIALHDAVLGRGWRILGIRGLDGASAFEFPAGTTIPARGYLVVVDIDPDVFRTLHAVPLAVPVVAAFTGGLDNGGERLTIERPDDELGALDWITVDQVRYDDAAPWPMSTDGAGPSLERFLATAWGDDAANWGASTREGGTPGSANSITAPGGNLLPEASFTATPPAGKAPLEVTFDGTRSFDLDGEIAAYTWDFGDGDTASGALVTHTFVDPGAYPVTLTVRDDDGATSAASRLVTVGEDLGGLRRPGDMNADGAVDISDPIAILRALFAGEVALPCGGDEIGSGGNRVVADSNGDGRVDLSDSVHLLLWLFQGGAPPTLGTDCTPVAGCTDACGG